MQHLLIGRSNHLLQLARVVCGNLPVALGFVFACDLFACDLMCAWLNEQAQPASRLPVAVYMKSGRWIRYSSESVTLSRVSTSGSCVSDW